MGNVLEHEESKVKPKVLKPDGKIGPDSGLILEESPSKSRYGKFQWRELLFVWICALTVRIYRIERGGFVIWDEAHFGKFAMHYLDREFFFDVHPPLGKMLTALSAYLAGVKDRFAFESEAAYPLSVDYGAMRVFHAVFGAVVPACVYAIVRSLGFSRLTARVLAFAAVFDNALVAISRLILLDPYLLATVVFSEVFLARVIMDSRRLQRLGPDLLGLGLGIGLAMSVKWIGCLTVAHVGFYATYVLLCEIRARRLAAIRLFVRLALALIVLPICVYALCFAVHFHILNRSGPGDGDMSSRFQAHLQNNEMLANEEKVLYGNRVTFRNSIPATGLLHSHVDRYPTGEQQITTYPHKDSNNHWRILMVGTDPDQVHYQEDLVLMHIQTSAYLAVEPRAAPLSHGHLVAALTKEEMNGAIQGNTVFTLEPAQKPSTPHSTVAPIDSFFYIRNKSNRCYLTYTGKKLPAWGHKQGEIVCTEEKSAGSLWNIEMNQIDDQPRLPKPPQTPSTKDFLQNFLELNLAMNAANNALVDDGKDTIGTRPEQWLFPRKWLRFNRWDGTIPRFAMVGNPFTWYLSTLNILTLLLATIAAFLKPKKSTNRYLSRRTGRLYLVFGGWLIHFLPFFLVNRIKYL
ncbi:dolichyl-phosphate-mannose-protein mannosyltransferase, partial [Nematocida homosporus]|uniref:dolichyl-phosphate-mannose-protein mannosyltransferase n=1 Tax=Nematocida homosporus TaxID=1912981 RepID=UPI00221FB012